MESRSFLRVLGYIQIHINQFEMEKKLKFISIFFPYRYYYMAAPLFKNILGLGAKFIVFDFKNLDFSQFLNLKI